MRLVRLGERGKEIPGVQLSDSSTVLDARSVTSDFDPEFFASGGVERLRTAMKNGQLAPLSDAGLRIGAPIGKPEKIVCIGLNYRNHARESGMEVPNEPIIFMKAPNTLVGPHDDVWIPRKSQKTDWEIELAVVMGTKVSYLASPAEALACVAGYAISNDVSEREFHSSAVVNGTRASPVPRSIPSDRGSSLRTKFQIPSDSICSSRSMANAYRTRTLPT